jgi:PleD family two-component response regulator
MTAERILEKFNDKKLPLTGLSIGLAKLVRHEGKKLSEDIATLVKRSDNALYKAKNTGRNRVVTDLEPSSSDE